MNKKGFTLIELLATVVILSVIVMITTPNVMNLVDNSKKTLFIDDAREIVSKATYLYNQDEYKNNENFFEKQEDGSYKIYIKNIGNLKTKKDAYGNKYNLNSSYITFSEPLNENGLNEREVKIYVESCDNSEKCLYICNENIHSLSTDSIKTSCN